MGYMYWGYEDEHLKHDVHDVTNADLTCTTFDDHDGLTGALPNPSEYRVFGNGPMSSGKSDDLVTDGC